MLTADHNKEALLVALQWLSVANCQTVLAVLADATRVGVVDTATVAAVVSGKVAAAVAVVAAVPPPEEDLPRPSYVSCPSCGRGQLLPVASGESGLIVVGCRVCRYSKVQP